MFNAAIINIGLSLSGGHSFSSIKVPSPDRLTCRVDPVKAHMDTVIVPIKKVLFMKGGGDACHDKCSFCRCHSGHQNQSSRSAPSRGRPAETSPLMAAKSVNGEKFTYKNRDVPLPHNDIMNIAVALLKEFFILMTTLLRRGLSKSVLSLCISPCVIHATIHAHAKSFFFYQIKSGSNCKTQLKCDVHTLPQTRARRPDCVSASPPGLQHLNHMIHM